MLHFDPAKEANYLREREAGERKAAGLALTESARRHHEELAEQYALMIRALVEAPGPSRTPKRKRAFLSWFG